MRKQYFAEAIRPRYETAVASSKFMEGVGGREGEVSINAVQCGSQFKLLGCAV